MAFDRIWRRAISPSGWALGLFAVLPCMAVGQGPGDGGEDPLLPLGVSGSAPDIGSPGVSRQMVTVTYSGFPEADRSTISDDDIWVVSRNGYNQTGTVVSVEWVAPLVPLPAPDGFVPPMLWGGLRVTYAFAPGHDRFWSARDNGDYTILLQDNEVATTAGVPYPGQVLGYFKVAVDAPPPPDQERVFPVETAISFERFPTPGVPGGDYLELVVASAKLRFAEPGVHLEWAADLRREENTFVASAIALAPPVDTPDRPPGDAGSVEERRFELSVLGAGEYRFVVEVNGRAVARAGFAVGGGGGGGGEPLPVQPDGVDIRVHEFPSIAIFPPPPAVWGAEVWLHFENPEQVVVRDWGRVVRERGNLSVEVSAFLGGGDGGVGADGEPLPPEVPLHHVYELGELDPGAYLFSVVSQGRVVGRTEFVVPRGGGGGGGGEDTEPPTVRVEAAAVEDPGERPQQIVIRYHDRSGLDLGQLEAMPVMVFGPTGAALPAVPTDFTYTEDFPSTQAIATYEVHPPGGSWGIEDNGVYKVVLEPGMVVDLLGNHRDPEQGTVGRFEVLIWPEPDSRPEPVEIEVTRGDDGAGMLAHVALRLPAEFAARDDWEVDWGTPLHRGYAFVAKVRFGPAGRSDGERPDGGGEEPRAEVDPVGWLPVPAGEVPDEAAGGGEGDARWHIVRHTYRLGELRPGRYLMVVLSNRGHFGKHGFAVESDGPVDPADPDREVPDGPSPFERWHLAALERDGTVTDPVDHENMDAGMAQDLFEYSAGTDPLDPSDDCQACLELRRPVRATGDGTVELKFRRILTGSDLRHRFEVSDDLLHWSPAGDSVAIVGSEPRLDGIEEVGVRWSPSLRPGEGGRYVRLVVDRVTD